MVTVEEATASVMSALYKPVSQQVPLHQAVGRVLAETIFADRDFPPFNRVAMDGVAIQYAAWQLGKRAFGVEGVQAAGAPQKKLTNKNNCLEVMTGAMLPEGADTVIPYEDITIENGVATITIPSIVFGQHVHAQAQDAQQGEMVLEPGITLSSAEVALLASVGKSNVTVFSFPKVAVISTGDELVEVDAQPAAHQIRRSNTYALQAAMQSMGWESSSFHLADNKESIVQSLRSILERHDVIILSGSVSKGKFDYVPEALNEIGIRKVFHQVNQRPGKPFWFGVSAKGKTVFALPGNPVSTYMCFYRYIKPWLIKSLGTELPVLSAVLASDFSFAPNLTYFLQVSVNVAQGMLKAYPVQGGGSGDFANLKKVTGFLELPADRSAFSAGEIFPYIPFRSVG